MTNLVTREQFLAMVQDYVEKDPEVAAHIHRYVEAGLRAALNTANERAADMEAALALMMAERYDKRKAKEFVKERLRKWAGQTSMKWDSILGEK